MNKVALLFLSVLLMLGVVTNVYATEVVVSTADPEVNLAGTFSTPEGMNEGPVVIFITGSGDHERDGVISGTPVYKILSDTLNNLGYATLRVDDRGTGSSTGPSTRESINAERLQDTVGTVEFVAGYTNFKATEIGLLGLSEGAMLAAEAAVELPELVDWLIMLSTPARPGSEVWFDQQIAAFIGQFGADHPNVVDARERIKEVIALSVANADYDTMDEAAVRLFAAGEIDEETARNAGMIAGFSERMTDRWMRDFLAHDPGVAQRQVTQPVLAVYGAIDRLTSPALNSGPLMSNLAEAPATDIQLVVLPDQDHFFLRGENLEPGEHKFGEMIVAPELLNTIRHWLERH